MSCLLFRCLRKNKDKFPFLHFHNTTHHNSNYLTDCYISLHYLTIFRDGSPLFHIHTNSKVIRYCSLFCCLKRFQDGFHHWYQTCCCWIGYCLKNFQGGFHYRFHLYGCWKRHYLKSSRVRFHLGYSTCCCWKYRNCSHY